MKNSWLIVGAVVGGMFGVTMGACGQKATSSGSGGGSTSSGSTSTGSTSTGSTSTSTSSSGMGGNASSSSGMGGSTSSGMGGAGGGGICSKVTTLHPPKADAGTDTIYCPFSGPDGGKSVYCKNENDSMPEHCCQPDGKGLPTSECLPTATKCADAIMLPKGKYFVDYECEDPGDCKQGEVCCSNAQASIGLGGMQNGMQCGNFAHKFQSTSCAPGPTCAAGIQMCTSDGECPKGMKCTPFGKAGNQLGGCM